MYCEACSFRCWCCCILQANLQFVHHCRQRRLYQKMQLQGAMHTAFHTSHIKWTKKGKAHRAVQRCYKVRDIKQVYIELLSQKTPLAFCSTLMFSPTVHEVLGSHSRQCLQSGTHLILPYIGDPEKTCNHNHLISRPTDGSIIQILPSTQITSCPHHTAMITPYEYTSVAQHQ